MLRAIGDSRTPLVAMMAAAITNILLDALAVFVLGWGIAGAAAATVFAQCLSGTICALRIARTPVLRFEKKHLSFDAPLSSSLLRLGLPVAFKNVIISIGGILLQSIVNGFGMAFIAGYTATNKLYGLLEIAALSYGYAVTTYVGQNFGAGEYTRIRKGVKTAIFLCLATALAIALVMITFGRPITGLFLTADDPAVLAQAAGTAYRYLCVMAVSLPALYLLYVYQSALQGLGQTAIGLIVGTLELCLRVGFALISGALLWAEGLFVAEVSAWIGAAILLCIVYYRHIRRLPCKSD